MYLPYLVVILCRHCISFCDVFWKYSEVDSTFNLHIMMNSRVLSGVCNEVNEEVYHNQICIIELRTLVGQSLAQILVFETGCLE